MGNGDALGVTFGSVVESAITGRSDAQYDRLKTTQSSAVTVSNIVAGTTSILKLERDHDSANDTYVQDVGVYGIIIQYSRQIDTP